MIVHIVDDRSYHTTEDTGEKRFYHEVYHRYIPVEYFDHVHWEEYGNTWVDDDGQERTHVERELVLIGKDCTHLVADLARAQLIFDAWLEAQPGQIFDAQTPEELDVPKDGG